MGWWLVAKTCALAYAALLIGCVVKSFPTWTYAFFVPLIVIGIYADYRADKAGRLALTPARRHD